MLGIPTAALTMALTQEGAPQPVFMNRKRTNSRGRVCIRYYDAKAVIHWYRNVFPLQQQARLQAQKERRKTKGETK